MMGQMVRLKGQPVKKKRNASRESSAFVTLHPAKKQKTHATTSSSTPKRSLIIRLPVPRKALKEPSVSAAAAKTAADPSSTTAPAPSPASLAPPQPLQDANGPYEALTTELTTLKTSLTRLQEQAESQHQALKSSMDRRLEDERSERKRLERKFNRIMEKAEEERADQVAVLGVEYARKFAGLEYQVQLLRLAVERVGEDAEKKRGGSVEGEKGAASGVDGEVAALKQKIDGLRGAVDRHDARLYGIETRQASIS